MRKRIFAILSTIFATPIFAEVLPFTTQPFFIAARCAEYSQCVLDGRRILNENSIRNTSAADTDALSITIICRDNPLCIFQNEDIVIDVHVKNMTDHEIGLPILFIRKKGLHCFLVNDFTNKKLTLNVSITPPNLTTEFVNVIPKESINFSRTISAGAIRSIQDSDADITAHLAVAGLILLDKDQEPAYFVKSGEVKITGK